MGQLFSACSSDNTNAYSEVNDRAPQDNGPEYGSIGGKGGAGAGGARAPSGGRLSELQKNADPFGIRSPSLYVSRTPMDAAAKAAAKAGGKGRNGRKRGAAAALAARQRQRQAEKRLSAELDGAGAGASLPPPHQYPRAAVSSRGALGSPPANIPRSAVAAARTDAQGLANSLQG